ncbi:MAG: hypothetical protein M1828_006073 [Chrysothrix sp. TS-e1954]|nr:MAG: hypothetical protein M1828_006073 [Chrysothrix sp. TS-e1954]
MASIFKSKVKETVGGHTSAGTSEEDSDLARKYMLRVTAGPAYDPSTHKPVEVNSSNPLFIENDLIKAKILVRIRDYDGLPKGSQKDSPYFSDPAHGKDQYSIACSFVPKIDLPAKDLVWGNDFDHPVRDRLPPGFNTAFKIVKEFIDPGLSCDAYADQPWLYGPALSCWFTLSIGDEEDENAPQAFTICGDKDPLKEGATGSGIRLRESLELPEASEKRRKHFLDEQARQNFVFQKGRVYQFDFSNPYLDFNKFALRLPGFSLSVIKYINDKTHHLRYVFKNVKTGEVFFVVVLTLLFGDDVQQALKT